jgi:hypothetical protein
MMPMPRVSVPTIPIVVYHIPVAKASGFLFFCVFWIINYYGLGGFVD